MQRTKAERAGVVAELMARRADMGLYRGRPIARPRMPRTHAWHTSKGVGAAEYRAKLRGPGRPSLKSRLQADVVELYRSGVTQGSIALRLRCSLSTVRRALADAGETAKRQR